jgi:linoleoyl-CoA desaturase
MQKYIAMKALKFSSSEAYQKEFGIALRKNVSHYFKLKAIDTKGNWSMYFKAIIMLGIYIIPFVILLSMPIHIGWAVLLVVLMGIGEAGIGMSVMHDAAHGAFSHKKWVNQLFASTMYLLGSTTFNWKIQHNLWHHTYTNIYRYDTDIDTKGIIRLCEHAPWKKHHQWQYIYAFPIYGLMTLSKLVMDFGFLVMINKKGVTTGQNRSPKLEMFYLILAKLLYFLVIIGLPIVLSDFSWWQILVGFAILHVTAGMIMSTVFQMAHVVEGAVQALPNADGIIESDWLVHQLRATSDFARNNHFLNWYIGGLNFQIEHHLFTNICHIHYAKIAPIVERTAREFGLAYNLKPTFGDALSSHIRRLKELGVQPVVATDVIE